MRYIGSKVLLLEKIAEIIKEQAPDAKTFCDLFSGTASVARFFKKDYEIYSNDLLYFSYILQKATIELNEVPDFSGLLTKYGINDPVAYFNDMETSDMECLEQERRFFQNTYAPTGGRMYLNDDNALRIDFARNKVNEWLEEGTIEDNEFYYLVACIVEGIPFVSNISGTYGAYHKKWDKRTFNKFELFCLDVVQNNRENHCYNEDGVQLLKKISGDVLYLDPPYNERQYLPNYHVLETAAKYDSPEVHGITGVRSYDKEKSTFCQKKNAIQSFDELMQNAQFKHIFMSYSTDGIMPLEEIETTMKKYGIPDTFKVTFIPYRRFKSREQAEKEELKEMVIYIRKEI